MLGTTEILLILCIILLLFGGKRLPELARSLGKGIREFKHACNGINDEDAADSTPQKQQVAYETESPEKQNDAD